MNDIKERLETNYQKRKSSKKIDPQDYPIGSIENPIYVYDSKYGWKRVLVYFFALGIVMYIYLIVSHQENVIRKTVMEEGLGENAKKKNPGRVISNMIVGEKPQAIFRKTNVKFSDVLGIDESKRELQEVVEFLKRPEKFNKLGGKIPKGVLLHGMPGTGKTMLAQAVAGEANVPFFYASASSFEEVFVGVGSKRIRQLFEEARRVAPCIIFIDEIDSIAGKRRGTDSSSSRQALNQLLNEMDGFNKGHENIIVIGATNFYQSLDRAILRPGRFDKIVNVPLPDFQGRLTMLRKFFKKGSLAPEVNLHLVAKTCTGLSGADLANIQNNSAIRASKLGKSKITMEDIDVAIDRRVMGIERKSRKARKEELYSTSIHEIGHSLISILRNPKDTQLHKVTVVPRGDALGFTAYVANSDTPNYTKKDLIDFIYLSLGGRVAEEIFFGEDHVSIGASDDLKKATNIAYEMVTKFGMSNLGFVSFQDTVVSENTKMKIDKEVKNIIDDCYNNTKKMLLKKKKLIKDIAEVLMEYETITGKEFVELMNGKKLKRNIGETPRFE